MPHRFYNKEEEEEEEEEEEGGGGGGGGGRERERERERERLRVHDLSYMEQSNIGTALKTAFRRFQRENNYRLSRTLRKHFCSVV